MRVLDCYSESLLTMVKLEDLAPGDHPLRVILTRINEVMAKMSSSFEEIHAGDAEGGAREAGAGCSCRCSTAFVAGDKWPSKAQYNLLFHWFGRWSIDDAVWNHTGFSKNRDMAQQRGPLAVEHFSIDRALTQNWARRKSMRRKDCSDGRKLPKDFLGEKRSNKIHASNSDPVSQFYRKSDSAPALLSYLGHLLTDNRHGLAKNAAGQANGRTAREVAVDMPADAAGGRRVTIGADNKVYDSGDFFSPPRERGVTPHLARNLNRIGCGAINGRTVCYAGYESSQRRCRCIGQCFGWGKPILPLRRVMSRRALARSSKGRPA